MGKSRRSGATTSVALVVASLILVGCFPPPRGGGSGTTTSKVTTPRPPEIEAFFVRGGVGSAPAVLALNWSISDPNGDTLTCRLDSGDGTDVVVDDCPEDGSRNLVVAAPGDGSATLTVDDGSSDPVSESLSFSVPAGPSEPFDVELRGIGDLEPAVASAFTDAAERWSAIVVRGIEDFEIEPSAECQPEGYEPLPAVIDDIIIDVSVTEIDGPSGILGQAGPTCLNPDNELPITGVMEFDVDDVEELLAEDALHAVVLHEMAHVLGFATAWDMTVFPGGDRKVINGAGTSSPRYTGARAVAEWSSLGGTGNVPVENTGGPGTADAHWRESIFGHELMTGWLDAGPTPLSRMSIASMADLGFHVDLDAADPFTLAAARAPARGDGSERAAHGTIVRPPLGPAR